MNHEIKNPKAFTEDIRAFEVTDRAHANVLNDVVEPLVNNDAYLKEQHDLLKEAVNEHIGADGFHVTAEEKETWNDKADKTEATKSAAGLMSAADKKKLDGIEGGAKPNQNAIGSIKIGSVTVQANTETAQIELAAGTNITLTADNATKKITVAAKDTTYGTASQSGAGLMSAADKKKLDGIAAGAQANTLTGVKGDAEGLYRTGNVNLTPSHIGAAPASHTHDDRYYTEAEVNSLLAGKAGSSHSQAASTVTAGTLAGRVQANAAAAAAIGNAQVRDIYAGTAEMTAGTTVLTTGTIYIQYE